MTLAVNHDFFSVIDSEEKAYWLGFFAADGCVYRYHRTPKSVNMIGLGLGFRDKEHVSAFREAVGSQHKVSTSILKGQSSPYIAQIRFTSPQMATDLTRHGVGPDKFNTRRPWVSDQPELLRHYWRGVVDGDGWICTGKRTYLGMSGNESVVRGFWNYVQPLITSPAVPHTKKSIWVIQYTGVAAKAIANHLYADATVYLPRKAESARQIS